MCIMRMWCKSVRAKYNYRGVRVGEARNPGPPKWLRMPEVREVAITPAVRAVLAWLDQLDLVEKFKPRASVMKSVPKFFVTSRSSVGRGRWG